MHLEVERSEQKAFPAAQVFALIAGLLGALVAQFVLDAMADSSDTWHQIQHGLLFAGGLAVGWSLTSLYAIAQRRSPR
jgi:uncharacterized oligopeptide transporter (OPT) family protein